jgi:acyl carrier protein
MTIARLKSSQKATAMREVLASNDVRTLVAKHLGVSVGRVTDEAHFTNDLGADWLDRLELMMVVEDHFAKIIWRNRDGSDPALSGAHALWAFRARRSVRTSCWPQGSCERTLLPDLPP